MASNSTTITKVVAAIVAPVVLIIIIILVVYIFLRRRRKRNGGPSACEVELTHSPELSRHPNAFKEIEVAPGRYSKGSASPYTNAREPPVPIGRPYHEEHDAVDSPSDTNQVLLHGHEISPPLTYRGEQALRLSGSTLPHSEAQALVPSGQSPEPTTSKGQYQPMKPSPTQSQTYYSPSITSPPPTSTTIGSTPATPLTGNLDSPINPDSTSPSFPYNTHLHPVHTHLPRSLSKRLQRGSGSSLLSSLISSAGSAASTESLTGRVNPAYAATQRERLARHSPARKRWDLIGLGSDLSSNGGGWTINKSKKLPDIKTTMEKTQKGGGVPETVVTAPTPSPPTKQLRIKIKKSSALPTHPAAEGTPLLDTIPDEPRSAPAIQGVKRADLDHAVAGGGGGAGGRFRSESDTGPPDIFGRGSMTDQNFVKSGDRQFPGRLELKRSAIRVDARGRIMRP